MKRHGYSRSGDRQRWEVYFSALSLGFWDTPATVVRRMFRNWPCGACGLWRRAKVHR